MIEKDLSYQEVISRSLEIIVGEMKKSSAEQTHKILAERLILRMSYDEFRTLFSQAATCVLRGKRELRPFEIDIVNEPIIRQLFFYASGDMSFSGDLHKGIMVQGRYGCGKTLIMESYAYLHNLLITRLELRLPLLTFTSSTELVCQIKLQGIKPFSRRTLVIDEFGREPKTVLDFGNTIRPVAELLNARAESGATTHGTTNFSLETLSSDDFYGKMVGDRLRAMFNFIVLVGDSSRR